MNYFYNILGLTIIQIILVICHSMLTYLLYFYKIYCDGISNIDNYFTWIINFINYLPNNVQILSFISLIFIEILFVLFSKRIINKVNNYD